MRRSVDEDGGDVRGLQRDDRKRGFYGLLRAETDGDGASAAPSSHNNVAVAVVTSAMLVSATLIFLARHRLDAGLCSASTGTCNSIRLAYA